MKQIHIKYVLLAITLASLITPGYAQYTGGNGKGDQQLAFSDITLNGTLLADLTSYTGGSGKGDAWIIAEDVNLSGVALSGLVYTGGSGRGDALATSNDNIPLGKYFVGTTADFTLGSNWNDGAFPSSEVAIVNSLASNQPVLSGSQTIASGTTINILSGASLTIAPTGVLTVNGTLNNSGTLTLQSNATGSASIGNSSGSVTGNVTVERFIPSNGRRWRYLSAPFASGPTIASSWQQQIHITGSGTGGTVCPTLTPHTNGFDATTLNNPGMMTFNETVATAPSFTNGYTAVSNTNATNLSAGNGYIVFIRGGTLTRMQFAGWYKPNSRRCNT